MHGIRNTVTDRAYVEALEAYAEALDAADLRSRTDAFSIELVRRQDQEVSEAVSRARVALDAAFGDNLSETVLEALYEASAALTFVADALEEGK